MVRVSPELVGEVADEVGLSKPARFMLERLMAVEGDMSKKVYDVLCKKLTDDDFPKLNEAFGLLVDRTPGLEEQE